GALGPSRYISIQRHQQPAHGHQCEEKTPKKHDAMLSTAAVGVGVLNVPSEALCFQRTMSLVIPITAIVDLVLPEYKQPSRGPQVIRKGHATLVAAGVGAAGGVSVVRCRAWRGRGWYGVLY